MNLIFQWMVTGLAALFASVLITACGAHSSNQSSENFTVYEDTPKMSLLDLGAPGNSLGDVYHFSAPLHSERGGPVTGEVIGSKTLVKVATDANPNLERRATLLFLHLLIARIRLSRSELPIIRRLLLSSMPASLPYAQFWAEPVNTWVCVARSLARGMRTDRTLKYSRD